MVVVMVMGAMMVMVNKGMDCDGVDDGYGEIAMTVMQIRRRQIKTRTVHNRACLT